MELKASGEYGGENCLVEPQMWPNVPVIESCLLFVFDFHVQLDILKKYTHFQAFSFMETMQIIYNCMVINILLLSQNVENEYNWVNVKIFICLQLR